VEGEIIIRPFAKGDPIPEITALLHRSYAQLARMGLRYLATHQDDVVTVQRLTDGTSFLALHEGRIIGTISCYDSEHTSGSPFLDRDGVGLIGQFGVEPSMQRRGIGRQLLDRAEAHAREIGLEEVALDTAESARHLIDWYFRLGYRFVEFVSWDVTNYRSVVLGKKLR
jgi:GNAT superfamily N-acetyltransferase